MKKAVLLLLTIIVWAGEPISAAFQSDPNPKVLDVQIVGDPRSGLKLYGVYFYAEANDIPEGDSEYQWYQIENPGISDTVAIAGANDKSILLTDDLIGQYIGFSVRPVDVYGNGSDSTYFVSVCAGPVINDPPAAKLVSITGSKMVNGVLSGNYIYSDTEGDTEGGSQYRWFSSDTLTGIYGPIPGETLRTHVITMEEQGRNFRFEVTPIAATGTSPGSPALSPDYGPANTKPYADNVNITGTPALGETITGSFQYHDVDGDLSGDTIMQWYRESEPIPEANGIDYVLSIDDVDSRIRFQVTPVSLTGYPDTGDPVMSDYSDSVSDPTGTVPVATELCISGIRTIGEELTGKYHYENKYKEKDSEYYWYRDNTIVQSGTAKELKKYKLKADDIEHVIRFAVIPKNSRAQSGMMAYSDTLAMFTMFKDVFTVTDPDIELEAAPGGGIFWGEGVTNGIFSPSSVDYAKSPFTVNYQVSIKNDNTECLQEASASLTVTGISMYFDSFRDVYCQNGGYDTIYVSNIPGGSTDMQFRLTDSDAIIGLYGPSGIIIDPGMMRAGNREDTLYFQAMSGLSLLSVFRTFIIDSIAPVSILNLSPGNSYCNNMDPFELFASPSGGYFIGPVSDSLFSPQLAVGDTAVRYTYTTKMGCVSSVRVPVTINPAPIVSFHVADNCIENSSDTTRFINTTISTDTVNSWLWEFYESGETTTKSIPEPGFLYTAGGLYRVTLTATTINNCLAQKDTFIDLGKKPVAGFYWENECFHPADSLYLFDATIFTTPVLSRSWNFFDGDSIHTTRDTWYPKKNTGYLPVEYIVKTNYPGCHDTVTKQIYIRPTIIIDKDDYLESFEGGNGGWVKDYETNNSWTFGKPDRPYINSAASGDSAWYTGYNITDQNPESSSVISPCFDLTAVQRPMITLNLWKRFDVNRDGAALQYTIGDSGLWEYVGTLDDGINWYNSALIKGKPGGDKTGWTSFEQQKDNFWSEARHRLDNLAGEKDVKLRIAYGSDGTSQDNDGIAFDDIRIGPRTRGILLEHFTNTGSVAGSEADYLVSQIASRDTADVINIQYHTNFPGADMFYNDNPGDLSGRLLFYGVARIPYTFVDGGTEKDFAAIYDYMGTTIDSKDLAKRSLINPAFTIDLESDVSGGVITVSGRVKASGALNAENVTLYLAVTEKNKQVTAEDAGALGETEFFNIFRKFIPDAGGISLERNWSKDDEYAFTERSWIIEHISDNADIEMIAFIQNNITKEVYQAVSKAKIAEGTGRKEEAITELKRFSLYPNPAINHLTVSFEEETMAGTEIKIYDFSGSLVRAYKPGSGTTDYNIENPGLKSGIYLVKVFVNGISNGYKKLVISGN